MNNEQIDVASKEIWERVKGIFISTLISDEDKSQAQRYFSMITSVAAKDEEFRIYTSNTFAADLLQNEYSDKLKSCFLLAGKPDTKLIFQYDESSRQTIVVPTVQQVKDPVVKTGKPNNFISTTPLNEDYTFDEFVRGQSNSWAYAAAKGVSEHPGETGYNPLFIHGGTGLGKTHLMQAIGNEIRKNNPSMAVCYLTAETFLNEFVTMLQNGEIQSFRDRYRKIDVLLIDDIQFLQKGKQCQEEFFNTFNVLKDDKKQIVLTSDVAPKDLPILDERLISRFVGGMVQEIESPNYETRLAILNKKAEGITPKIPENAIHFIADHIKSHVRAMEGALSKIKIAMSLNAMETLSNEMLERLLKDLIEKEQTYKKLTVEDIQEVVARKYDVRKEDILNSVRTQSIVTPRQLAMYISRKYTSKSLKEIADLFDKKHATIIHGVKTIENRLDVDEELRHKLDEILSEFGLSTTDAVG